MRRSSQYIIMYLKQIGTPFKVYKRIKILIIDSNLLITDIQEQQKLDEISSLYC